MDRLIYTALDALAVTRDTRVSIAQNLANMNVPGFRRDLPNEGGTQFLEAMNALPTRAFPTEAEGTLVSDAPGTISRTDQPLDIAIEGEGWFYVQPESGGEPALSRRGDLLRGSDGLLRNGAGDLMLDTGLQPIAVPDFQSVSITDLGEIIVEPVGGAAGEAVSVGVMATTLLEGEAGLMRGTDGEIRLPDGTVPQPDQRAVVVQGALEGSNVNPVEEMLQNIELQRNFEFGMRMVMNARDLDEAGSRLMQAPQA